MKTIAILLGAVSITNVLASPFDKHSARAVTVESKDGLEICCYDDIHDGKSCHPCVQGEIQGEIPSSSITITSTFTNPLSTTTSSSMTPTSPVQSPAPVCCLLYGKLPIASCDKCKTCLEDQTCVPPPAQDGTSTVPELASTLSLSGLCCITKDSNIINCDACPPEDEEFTMPTGTELWLPKKISGDNVQFMKARTASNQVKDTIDLKCCMHGLIPICVSDDSSACGLAEKALEVRQEENLCCYRVLETFGCYVCEKATAVDGAIQARAQNEDGDCCILWPGRYFSCAAGICPKGFTSTTITLPHPAAATAAVGARTLSNINLEAEKAVAAATFETVVEECHCIWFGVFVCTGCGKVDVTNTAIEAPTPVGAARRQQTYDFHLTCNGRYDVVAGKHQCKSSLIAGDACLSSCSCDGVGGMHCKPVGDCTVDETTKYCVKGNPYFGCACTRLPDRVPPQI